MGEFTEKFLEARRLDGIKSSTLNAYRDVSKLLVRHFGYDRSIATISVDDVKSFIGDLLRKQCKTSVSSVFRRCQMFFRYAVKQGFLSSTPFNFTIERVDSDESRWHYVTPGTIHKVLNFCRSDYERLALALGRFGACAVRLNSRSCDSVILPVM